MNITLGGAVHYSTDTDEFMPLPECGGNRSAERYTRTTQDVTCKRCLKIINAEREQREGKGETMAEAKTETNHAEIVDQIEANIERATSLVEAENIDGLKELEKETETLISSLPSRGRLDIEGRDAITFAALKKDMRAAWRGAAQAKPKPEPKAEVAHREAAPVKEYTDFEGVPELVNMGAEKVAEGVRLHIKTSTTAKEIAEVILDMWRRIPNKDGFPDITGTSDPAKKASSALYKAAGEALQGEDEFDVERAVKALIRSVQTQRTDVRAKYLRSLDEDSPEAEEERQHFAKLLESKPEGTPVSEFIANHYGVSLKGELEKARERQRELREGGNGDSSEGGSQGEPQGLTPEQEIRQALQAIKKDVTKVDVDKFESLPDEKRQEMKPEIEELYEAFKAMLAATL
ncbi:hypothetical protein ACIGPN_05975 [Streptomyces afghaniensis]|uniref:hypothetical protein n=1 Tax=Streptomyces afghaniensis TaxID=66865 RepID=UPI0037D47A2E